MSVRILVGDVRERLRDVPDGSVQTCVTSPPYFGLRDYGNAGQIGLEPTPDAYVAEMVAVFREVRRVLRDDGTLWLNLGDSYSSMRDSKATPDTLRGESDGTLVESGKAANRNPANLRAAGLKHKDLIGIPWRVAFALQADGWYLRQDIIWAKPNPMPESVRDRCTKSHEYIFLLSKSERYYYDADAIAEESIHAGAVVTNNNGKNSEMGEYGQTRGGFLRAEGVTVKDTRNKRSVWTVTTQPFKGAHFATFPPALIEPCILAGTSAHGCCPDCGAPWERVVERDAVGRTRLAGRGIDDDAGTAGRAGRTETTTIGWVPGCECEQHEDDDGVFIERPNEPTDRYAYRAVPCTVLDPFGGAGTTGLVADRLGRNAILCELNPEYAQMAERRIRDENPMFTQVSVSP